MKTILFLFCFVSLTCFASCKGSIIFVKKNTNYQIKRAIKKIDKKEQINLWWVQNPQECINELRLYVLSKKKNAQPKDKYSVLIYKYEGDFSKGESGTIVTKL